MGLGFHTPCEFLLLGPSISSLGSDFDLRKVTLKADLPLINKKGNNRKLLRPEKFFCLNNSHARILAVLAAKTGAKLRSHNEQEVLYLMKLNDHLDGVISGHT